MDHAVVFGLGHGLVEAPGSEGMTQGAAYSSGIAPEAAISA